MDAWAAADELEAIAERDLRDALDRLPTDPNGRVAFLVEVLRVLDYQSVLYSTLPPDRRIPHHTFDLMVWGWNRLAGELISQPTFEGALPHFGPDRGTRNLAFALLQHAGRSSLLRRVSAMLRTGLMEARNEGPLLALRCKEFVAAQHLDMLEPANWRSVVERIDNSDKKVTREWQVFDADEYAKVSRLPGSFFQRASRPYRRWLRDDIGKLMEPLVRPWDCGQGRLIGYDARPEVDDHFLAEAMERFLEWRDEAGVDPATRLSNTSGADLCVVAMFLTSLHLKHVRFAIIALTKFKNLDIENLLTIWGPKELLVESIAAWTGLGAVRARNALNALTVSPDDAALLRATTTPLIPLVVDLNNGLVIRPVSSLNRNPMLTALDLVDIREPSSAPAIRRPREDWLRSDVYSMFQGARYVSTDGNVKVRLAGNVATDIDGAVLDVVSGELALYQLKWQNWFTNDVKKLRSKAKNQTEELDKWADRVTEWINVQGGQGVLDSLRLRTPKVNAVSAIYLFAVTQGVARTRGLGFDSGNAKLAAATLPQFRRVRFQVGPVDNVFRRIHEVLREEAGRVSAAVPVPVEINAAGRRIRFENLWCAMSGDEERE